MRKCSPNRAARLAGLHAASGAIDEHLPLGAFAFIHAGVAVEVTTGDGGAALAAEVELCGIGLGEGRVGIVQGLALLGPIGGGDDAQGRGADGLLGLLHSGAHGADALGVALRPTGEAGDGASSLLLHRGFPFVTVATLSGSIREPGYEDWTGHVDPGLT